MPRRYQPGYADNLLSFLLLNLVFIVAYLIFKKNRRVKEVIIFFIIFCVFAFWNTDTAAYKWMFFDHQKWRWKEKIYYYLSFISFNSYYLWRTYVWGTATILFYYAAKNFRVNLSVAFYVLSLFFLMTFSYARASLAMATYIYGLSLVLNHRNIKKILYKGIFFILITPLFHRSYYVVVAMTPFLFIKINKKLVYALLLLSPLFSRLIQVLLQGFLNSQIELNENMDELSDSIQSYAGREAVRHYNWKFMLIKIMHRSSYYLSMGYILYYFFKKQTSVLFDHTMRKLITIMVLIAIIATFFILGGRTNYFYEIVGYRFLYMTSLPIVVILTYMYSRGILTKKQLFYNLALPFLYSEIWFVGKLIKIPAFW